MKTLSKGLDKEKVIEISELKKEPVWMKNFRLESYDIFKSMNMPKWGPKLDIDLDNITYYKNLIT